ncbi:MAG: glycosyl transferase [Dehalococcoidia bacterium]|nr:MAG: glycosyl transferase [Dehalococcoidia bacterium]
MLLSLAHLTYHRLVTLLGAALLLAQLAAAGRVVARFLRRRAARQITPSRAAPNSVTVIVPVLNEEERLEPCLEGLLRQGEEVAEILVVDGGSVDATRALVEAAAARDGRVRWLDASPVPPSWNGKAWGLEVGRRAARTPWLLCVDADVRPAPALAASLVAFAERERLTLLSAAIEQRLAGWLDALIHPAFLTTLVYRLGPPGTVARTVDVAQANGQCLLVHWRTLAELGGFHPIRSSRCEDVTLARIFVAAGERVAMAEAPSLAWVQMYDSAMAIWRNWPRSLPLVDQFGRPLAIRGLIEATLIQALPSLLLPFLLRTRSNVGRALAALNFVLLAGRIGVLVGAASAYPSRPWSYWLSPLADAPALIAIWVSLFRRRHLWRGRILVEGAPA